jgi:hypothetical protein
VKEIAKPEMTVFADNVGRSADPFTDSLSDGLQANRPSQRHVTRATVVLAALALAVVGFLGGALVQKHFGKTTSGGGQNTALTGGDRNPTVVRPASNVTTGTVKFLDGNTVYVQTADGKIVTVRTSGSTAVQVTSNGALGDLGPGAPVNIEGSATGDGVVNATRVTKGK